MASVSPALRTENYHWRTETSERSESRSSNRYVPLNHAGVVEDTLDTVVDGVNATAELIRRKHNENVMERRTFHTEMEVTGRMTVIPSEADRSTRLRSVSTEDIQKELSKLKDDQKQNAVKDTLAALVYDIDATAEVLRRGSFKKKKPIEVLDLKIFNFVEIEYKLRITPEPDIAQPVPSPRIRQAPEDSFTLERVSRDYGVEMSESQTSSLKKRARSETPRRTINVEALNLRGTYREHERKPYCHECFYRLYNGLIYAPDIKQTKIEKLI
ncbi:unnamed protein product [Enterobius vermicularis]|uniref:Retrotransposon protein n=1 Tax=Enterobius vermicularis TaxID=51028 RepID=A0A0N4VI85_ENTVE|nr:unnamed protein product [Enterobius vermicularis]